MPLKCWIKWYILVYLLGLGAVCTAQLGSLRQVRTPFPKNRISRGYGHALNATEDLEGALKPYNGHWVHESGLLIRYFNRQHHITFNVGSKEITFDGIKVYLTYPIVKNVRQKRIMIATMDVKNVLKPLLEPEKLIKNLNSKGCIVIDPGHGGSADGAKNNKRQLVEKMLTLRTAQALQSALKKEGYKTLLTRDKDTDLSLIQRGQIANKAGAQLFISIHYNASQSSTAQGIETYVCTLPFCPSTDRMQIVDTDCLNEVNNRYDMQNTYLAYCLQRRLSYIGCDRGVRRARFGVLRHVNCPAVLIECGYISNDQEAQRIPTQAYQEKLIGGIVEGIHNYLRSSNERIISMPMRTLKHNKVIP